MHSYVHETVKELRPIQKRKCSSGPESVLVSAYLWRHESHSGETQEARHKGWSLRRQEGSGH